MFDTHRARHVATFLSLLILSGMWFVAPSASEEGGANEGFIVFSTDRDNPSPLEICPGCEEIYAMLPDGSQQVRLTENNFNDKAPVWSHSKKLIAFHSNRTAGRPEIFLMNLDGTGQRRLASLGDAGAQFASFSHNGNELCFSSQTAPRDIYVVDIYGEALTNLTNHPSDDIRCDWSPKGNDILFTSNRDGNPEIYVMNADGTDPVRLTASPGVDTNPDWSPKGDRIAFESTRDGNSEIYVMSADGTDLERLTYLPGLDTKPSWSPTGDQIAFHRQIGLHLEVHTMNADGSGVTQITVPTLGAFSGFPSWGKWSNLR